ncbi:hypothetical protein RE476_05685 [Methanolobus mangrovi]|uniref:Uncharacterized protein n=1 Tax=Methanolobus mangrovi TaxID=3072977 RepID=A0AA51UJN0_9EURY|nr:hypothetical protein [Methanolobus mangrovi]WMW23317.1 hypothetical protein RE476_05685 [Methanolobus mangrovi]
MKKQIIVLILILTALIPVASADVVSDLDIKVNEYNENADKLPSFLKSLLGNEVIKLVILTNDEEEIYIKAITEDAYITVFEEIDENDEIGETIIIGTSENTVQSILNSEDPLTTFLDAKDNGELIIEPVGFVNNLTFAVANVLLKLSQLLGLI